MKKEDKSSPEIIEGKFKEIEDGEEKKSTVNKKINYVRNEEEPPYAVPQSRYEWPDDSPDIDPQGELYEDLAPDMQVLVDREPVIDDGAPHFTQNGTGREISFPQKFKGPKRTLTEREADLILITKWYLEGLNHHQIAERLSNLRGYTIKRAQISATIHEIYKRWKLSYLSDFNRLKVRELAKIDKLEAEYLEAWEASKADKVALERTQIDDTHGETKGREDGKGGGGKQAYSRVKTITKKEQRDPNAVYLEGVRWCIQKRCEIFGLNAPTTVNVNWRKQAEEAGLDPDAVLSDIEQQFVDAANVARTSQTRSLGTGAEED